MREVAFLTALGILESAQFRYGVPEDRWDEGVGLAGDTSTLSVQPDEVKALGRLAYDVACQCRDGYASLDSDVQHMLGRWLGNNAKVFATGWSEFHEGAVQVWDALFELAAGLGVTADTVRETDQAFAGGVSSLELP